MVYPWRKETAIFGYMRVTMRFSPCTRWGCSDQKWTSPHQSIRIKQTLLLSSQLP